MIRTGAPGKTLLDVETNRSTNSRMSPELPALETKEQEEDLQGRACPEIGAFVKGGPENLGEASKIIQIGLSLDNLRIY
jgi:hypothetical protein